METFEKAISAYENVSEEEARFLHVNFISFTLHNFAFRENLRHFLREVTPICEELDVFLAIHPDDPPIKLLGLPRIVSTEGDVKNILGKSCCHECCCWGC